LHTIYSAPEGYYFDWAIPRYDESGVELHLYVDKLSLCTFDTIDNYKLVARKDVEK
jgi:hypothetical protein